MLSVHDFSRFLKFSFPTELNNACRKVLHMLGAKYKPSCGIIRVISARGKIPF